MLSSLSNPIRKIPCLDQEEHSKQKEAFWDESCQVLQKLQAAGALCRDEVEP